MALALASAVLSGCGMFMESPAPPAPPPDVAQLIVVQPHCDEPVHLARPSISEAVAGTPPEVVTRVAPEYPMIVRQANVDGTVLAWLLVCEHGNVVDVRIVKSVAMLDAAAITAFAQWKFQPGRSGDQPIPMWVQMPMKFTLH